MPGCGRGRCGRSGSRRSVTTAWKPGSASSGSTESRGWRTRMTPLPTPWRSKCTQLTQIRSKETAMKRTVLSVALLLCLGASSAFAEPCERGFQLKTVGQTSEDTQTLLASGGVEVRAIWFTSTSSAGLATLNDSADTGGTTALGAGTVKIEVGSRSEEHT